MNLVDRINAGRPASVGEMERICSLPVAPRLTDEQREGLSRYWLKAKPYEGKCVCGNRTCTTPDKRGWADPFKNPCKCGRPRCKELLPHPKPVRLLTAQADGIFQFTTTGVGAFNIKVGGGKTALAQMIASHTFTQDRDARMLLLIPASVYHQFWFRDLPWGRSHLRDPFAPFIGLGSKTQKQRLILARSKRPGCYVLPYSCLSTQDTIEVLREINASLVIADEAQELREGSNSAKAKRWWSYVDRRDPPPRGVIMSGSLAGNTPMDYHRPLRWALRQNSPLPRAVVEATSWSKVLRAHKPGQEPEAHEIRELEPLVAWAKRTVPDDPVVELSVPGVRRAYQHRLTTVPGFVTSGDDSIGVGLEISNSPAADPAMLPGGDALLEYLYRVEADCRAPGGEVLKYGIEIHNAQRELTAGFYNRRYWDESHPLVEEAKACFFAEQDYAKELNRFFKSSKVPREGLDTPMVVGLHHARDGAVKGWEGLYELWLRWRSLQVEGLPERLTEPVRVCDYKVRHAVEWARRIKKGGILWCYHKAVADWIFESLTEIGLKCIMKGAGAVWLENDGSEKWFCVASIEAHYRGKNLQHHTNQLLVQWPRPADYCEQLIGRTHRTGQTADRLVVHTNHTLDFDHEQQAATLADTVYDFETIGGERKLLIADWNPPPREISAEFLRARGYRRGD